MDNLTINLILYILNFLQYEDIKYIYLVCKKFNRIEIKKLVSNKYIKKNFILYDNGNTKIKQKFMINIPNLYNENIKKILIEKTNCRYGELLLKIPILSNLTNLSILDIISCNIISKKIILENLCNLEKVRFVYNSSKDIKLYLNNLPKLSYISICSLDLSVFNIINTPCLKEIWYRNERCENIHSFMHIFSNIYTLKKLTIFHNDINNIYTGHLTLENLTLDTCNLNTIEWIKLFPALKYLDIRNTGITKKMIEDLNINIPEIIDN